MLFTPEHDALRESIRRFCVKELDPHVDAWEADEDFPLRAVFKKAGDAGLLGIDKPVAYGGLGLDFSYAILLAEELGRVASGGVGMALGVQAFMCTPALARKGSDELRRDWLAPSVAGDLVGCIGVSEEGAGSDVASLKTWAKREGGDYVISGGKMWITNGMKADWMCCLANTAEVGGPHFNKSLIVVPLDAKGVVRAGRLKKHGMRTSDTAQIFFDDVRVPRRHLIGEENYGFVYQMEQFQEERLFAAARSCVMMEEAIRLTIEYTRERRAFGRALLDNQWIHFTLADLATEVEAQRALTHKAIEEYVAGRDVTKLASMAKLKVGKLTRQVPDACMQFFGGQGYMLEARIGRIARDARLTSIGGGANEVMMAVIAKEMGMLSRRNR